MCCGLRTERSRDVSSGGMAFSSSHGQIEEAAQPERISWFPFCSEDTWRGGGGRGLATFSLVSFWVLNTTWAFFQL